MAEQPVQTLDVQGTMPAARKRRRANALESLCGLSLRPVWLFAQISAALGLLSISLTGEIAADGLRPVGWLGPLA